MKAARRLASLAALTILALASGMAGARPAMAATHNYSVIRQHAGTCASGILSTITAAVACANADPAGPNTITVWPGSYQEHDITIASNTTIRGKSRNVIVDARYQGRVFNITAGDVTIDGLTIMHGTADYGGGVSDTALSGTTLSLTNDIITWNRAGGGGGSPYGGGVYVGGPSLYADNVTMSYNRATRALGNTAYGGGLYFSGLPSGATITDTTITHNDLTAGTGSSAFGGGMYIATGGNVYLTNDVVTFNTASAGGSSSPGSALGGGAYFDATIDSINDTFSNNTTTGGFATSGGSGGSAYGGGVATVQFPMTFFLDNINGNQARGGGSTTPATNNAETFGGGLHVGAGGHVQLTATSVSFNTAGTPPGAPVTANGSGGGIFNGGALTLSDASLRGNTALGGQGWGGGIYNNIGASLYVDSGTIVTQNSAPGISGAGGGLYNNVGSASSDGTNAIKGNLAGIQTYNNCYPTNALIPDCYP